MEMQLLTPKDPDFEKREIEEVEWCGDAGIVMEMQLLKEGGDDGAA